MGGVSGAGVGSGTGPFGNNGVRQNSGFGGGQQNTNTANQQQPMQQTGFGGLGSMYGSGPSPYSQFQNPFGPQQQAQQALPQVGFGSSNQPTQQAQQYQGPITQNMLSNLNQPGQQQFMQQAQQQAQQMLQPGRMVNPYVQQQQQALQQAFGGTNQPTPQAPQYAQTQRPAFMNNPEFQGYEKQNEDLNRQLNDYVRQSPMYQQLQSPQGNQNQREDLSRQLDAYAKQSPMYQQLQGVQGKMRDFQQQATQHTIQQTPYNPDLSPSQMQMYRQAGGDNMPREQQQSMLKQIAPPGMGGLGAPQQTQTGFTGGLGSLGAAGQAALANQFFNTSAPTSAPTPQVAQPRPVAARPAPVAARPVQARPALSPQVAKKVPPGVMSAIQKAQQQQRVLR